MGAWKQGSRTVCLDRPLTTRVTHLLPMVTAHPSPLSPPPLSLSLSPPSLSLPLPLSISILPTHTHTHRARALKHMKNVTKMSSRHMQSCAHVCIHVHTKRQESVRVSTHVNSVKTSIRPARLLTQCSTLHAVLVSYTQGRLSSWPMIREEIAKMFHSLLTWWMFRRHNCKATQQLGHLGYVTGQGIRKNAKDLDINGENG